MTLQAPFPYFGGKSSIADVVWAALGDVPHYIEPFFGSGAVLLARPRFDATRHTETVNDKDGHLANVWRALQADPDAVARFCDWPVNHADLIARKAALNNRYAELLEKLCVDDKFFDAELAGYWIWAASCWIGSGLVRPGQRPHLSDAGKGVHKKGKIPHLGNAGMGVQDPYNTNLYSWFRRLSERLRYVRVVCGDWTRVCGGNWQAHSGTCGIFFDPPYSDKADRCSDLYSEDSLGVAHDVRVWALKRGASPDYRIVIAGYFEEHQDLLAHGWRYHCYSVSGGYSNIAGTGNISNNRHRETLFFSPHCLRQELGEQQPLFGAAECQERLL